MLKILAVVAVAILLVVVRNSIHCSCVTKTLRGYFPVFCGNTRFTHVTKDINPMSGRECSFIHLKYHDADKKQDETCYIAVGEIPEVMLEKDMLIPVYMPKDGPGNEPVVSAALMHNFQRDAIMYTILSFVAAGVAAYLFYLIIGR